MHFSKLAINDAKAMAAIERECFALPWSLAQCEIALKQKAFAAFGLWSGSTLIAYISLYHAAREFEILNLAVIASERRKGHGSRILALALQAADKMGMQKVVLEVRAGNAAAISLYEKSGFRKTGIRPRYYGDNGEDALIYSRVSRADGNANPEEEIKCKR